MNGFKHPALMQLTDQQVRYAPPARRLEQRALQKYEKDLGAARELIAVGESKPDPKLPAAELAAWIMVASQIMNLDESLTK